MHVYAIKAFGFAVAKAFTIALWRKNGSALYSSNYLVLQFDFIILAASKAKCTWVVYSRLKP